MKLERYESKRQGIREVLKSAGVRVNLLRRAERVAEAVRADYEARPPHEGEVEVVVRSSVGRNRARAEVIAIHPGVLPIEADRRPLGSALDAAR